MRFDQFLRASAFITILAVSPVAAQDAEHQEHHPGAAAEATAPTAKPALGAMPSGPEPGPVTGQGGVTMKAGVPANQGMAMMRKCMGMMESMMRGMGRVTWLQPHPTILSMGPSPPSTVACTATWRSPQAAIPTPLSRRR